jgi:hypothetical protein
MISLDYQGLPEKGLRKRKFNAEKNYCITTGDVPEDSWEDGGN